MIQTILKFFVLASILNAGTVSGANLTVIAHPGWGMSDISHEELRSIFLGTRSAIRGAGKVEPVLGTANSHLSMFAEEYLGKSGAALATYYRSMVFSGKWSMPMTFGSDAEVINYVARTPGAIGFVGDAAALERVKVLRVK